jgi:hypothetical protein
MMGHISRTDDTTQVEQIFNSSPEVVRTKGSPTPGWWECVWSYMTKGRIANWKRTCRNRNEWKKAIEKAKVHLCMQSQVRKEDIGRKKLYVNQRKVARYVV